MRKKQKVINIIGSTASGKTGIAVKACLKYDGEVVSADSRQVYRGMDIGTGKDLCEYKIEMQNKELKDEDYLFLKNNKNNKNLVKNDNGRIVANIPYHLIDVADPMDQFNLADFQKMAYSAIDDILDRKKLPIIAGGTGMYTQAIVDAYDLSNVKPDSSAREVLEAKDREELFEILKAYNKKFAENLNNSDKNNKRRLVRYIEMAKMQDKDLKIDKTDKNLRDKYEFLTIGLKWPREVLHSRIYKRLIERLEKEGMVEEVEDLHRRGVSWERLDSFGLEYRYISRYLRDMLSYEEMVDELHKAIKKFAKQQRKWYKRWERQGAEIYWFEGESGEMWQKIEEFLKN